MLKILEQVLFFFFIRICRCVPVFRYFLFPMATCFGYPYQTFFYHYIDVFLQIMPFSAINPISSVQQRMVNITVNITVTEFPGRTSLSTRIGSVSSLLIFAYFLFEVYIFSIILYCMGCLNCKEDALYLSDERFSSSYCKL